MTITVVNKKNRFQKLLNYYSKYKSYIYPIQTKSSDYYQVNNLCSVIIIIPKIDCLFYLPFNTIDYTNNNDKILNYLISNSLNFILNKRFLFRYSNIVNNCVDIQLVCNLENKTIDTYSRLLKHYRGVEDEIKYVPATSIINYIQTIHNSVFELTKNLLTSEETLKSYNKIHDTFLEINENSFMYNNEISYNNYDLHSKTNRPTNVSRTGVNLLAMSKNKELFSTKFNNDGLLLLMDYKNFVIKSICRVVNYNFNSDAYMELGEYYVSTGLMDANIRKEAKQMTFKILFSSMLTKYSEHPFFKKVLDFVNLKWNELLTNGRVKSILYGRLFYRSMVDNKFILFSYLMQNYETEYNYTMLSKVNNFLKDYKTSIVLYVYDSILIDFHKSEIDIMKKLKQIITDNGEMEIEFTYSSNLGDL
jgi:hypothetical protein